MQFIKKDINIDFVGKVRTAGIISCILVLISVGTIIIQGGPKYGIDFAGGTLIQIQFQKATAPETIRAAIKGLGVDESTVQPFGDVGDNEYLINIKRTVDDLEGLSGQVA
ncbi:MAG: protein translocase subunit SecF, partial [Deltaproteobacteria bacterium]|nr:protein translocase subunit SecF [Deltaproteobacteria bacterium]